MQKIIMSKGNISKFKDMLASTSWNDLYEGNHADLAYQHFIKVINCCFNDCFPIGNVT